MTNKEQLIYSYLQKRFSRDDMFFFKTIELKNMYTDAMKFRIGLKHQPGWEIDYSIDNFTLQCLVDNNEVITYIDTQIDHLKMSLVNKYNEDTKNFATHDNVVNKRYENSDNLIMTGYSTDKWEELMLEGFNSELEFYAAYQDYPPCDEYTMVNPCQAGATADLFSAIGDPSVKSDKMKCTTCADTGIVDSAIYGTWPCPSCEPQDEPEPEKEMSAWDKKLKEELNNGDDTWGSIAKKYKK